ncbi:MAG: hypothetical protein R3B47_07190 [Bacteroidia bacterium]
MVQDVPRDRFQGVEFIRGRYAISGPGSRRSMQIVITVTEVSDELSKLTPTMPLLAEISISK